MGRREVSTYCIVGVVDGDGMQRKSDLVIYAWKVIAQLHPGSSWKLSFKFTPYYYYRYSSTLLIVSLERASVEKNSAPNNRIRSLQH
jgi:hypothetical protein